MNTTSVVIGGEICGTVLALAAMGRDMALKGLLKFSVGPAPVRKAPAATDSAVAAAGTEAPAASAVPITDAKRSAA